MVSVRIVVGIQGRTLIVVGWIEVDQSAGIDAALDVVDESHGIFVVDFDSVTIRPHPCYALDEIVFVETSVHSPISALASATDNPTVHNARPVRPIQEES